jgi:hypothetical protein
MTAQPVPSLGAKVDVLKIEIWSVFVMYSIIDSL